MIINTTPLVDVVFLLLIFFVITPILENSNRIEINLPNATVEQVESSFQTLEVAIVENIQREELNIVEEAKGYKRLNEEFGYDHEKIANMMSNQHIGTLDC